MALFGKPHKNVNKPKSFNEEKLLERGWTVEAIKEFINDSYNYIDQNQKKVWHQSNIEKVENSIDFIFFNKRKEFDNLTEIGKNFSTSLNIDFSKGNHLLAKIDNYDTSRSIFHLVKNDFAPDTNSSYSLFTDGSFKTVDKKAFASCGGWIIDNKTKEVIIEFSKPVELDETKKRSQPKFELIGIAEGAKIINQLGIKNVQIYTDSLNESRRLFLASLNCKDDYYKEHANIYDPILDNIKNSKSSISWIPREYNHHADELSEISLKTWEKKNEGNYKDKDYIAENGYQINRDQVIYFHQNKADFKPHKELTNRFTLLIANNKNGEEEYIVSLIHDREKHRLSILESIPKNFSYIDETLPESIKQTKKAKPDGIVLVQLARAINSTKNLGDINICVTPLITAVDNKVTPIPSDLQEEFFEFHKALNEYSGQITMTYKWPKLIEKVKGYLQPSPNYINSSSKPKI